ncbi:MAG TPA: hypothetical protein VEA38_21545 [Terriglobales bacterium]|nr:hypothetical protein [Terriglobales bacterium]
MRTRWVSALVLVLTVGAAAAHAAEARAVVERYLTRVSGAALRDLTLEQDLTLYNLDGRAVFASGIQRVIIKFPDRQRVEQVIEGRTDVRLTVGDKTWRRAADGRVTSFASPRGQSVALALPLARSADEILAEWRGLGVREDRVHVTRLGGRTVTVIGAQQGERDRPAAWLDPDLGVMRFVAREPAESGSVLTDIVFGDHRALLGALHFPWRQEIFRSGKLVVRSIVRSAAVNTSPPDALFDPAALGAR